MLTVAEGSQSLQGVCCWVLLCDLQEVEDGNEGRQMPNLKGHNLAVIGYTFQPRIQSIQLCSCALNLVAFLARQAYDPRGQLRIDMYSTFPNQRDHKEEASCVSILDLHQV